jgi:hypothetical protein
MGDVRISFAATSSRPIRVNSAPAHGLLNDGPTTTATFPCFVGAPKFPRPYIFPIEQFVKNYNCNNSTNFVDYDLII